MSNDPRTHLVVLKFVSKMAMFTVLLSVGCAMGFLAPTRLLAPEARAGYPARCHPPLSLAAAAELSFEPPAGLGEVGVHAVGEWRLKAPGS